MVVSLYHIRSSPFAESPLVKRDEELMRKRRALAIRSIFTRGSDLHTGETMGMEHSSRAYRLPRLPALLVSTLNRTDRHYLRRGKTTEAFACVLF